MGKFPASLLSIVFQLYLIDSVFADDGVRKLQEALRKRHLFSGEITGEITPALTAAIFRYQEKKGFRRTGSPDPETLASLGVVTKAARATPTIPPFVVVETGDVRDANGESLPAFAEAYHSTSPPEIESASPASETQRIAALTSAGDDAAALVKTLSASHSRSRARPRRAPQPQETNPFILAFRTVDHAMKLIVNDTQPKTKRAAAKRPL